MFNFTEYVDVNEKLTLEILEQNQTLPFLWMNSIKADAKIATYNRTDNITEYYGVYCSSIMPCNTSEKGYFNTTTGALIIF